MSASRAQVRSSASVTRNWLFEARTSRFRRDLANGWLRRVSPIAPTPGEGLLTEPTPAARSWPRERVFMPLSSHSRINVEASLPRFQCFGIYGSARMAVLQVASTDGLAGCPEYLRHRWGRGFGPGRWRGCACREHDQEAASCLRHTHLTPPIPGYHAFSSRLTLSRKRQSVPSAMIFCGLDLIRPTSRRRRA